MSPVEREDLPDMSDMCFGHEACAGPCQEFNYPNPCPCGLETKEEE